jgi:hypothetical protein
MKTENLIEMISELLATGKMFRKAQKAFELETGSATIMKLYEKQFDELLERMEREAKAWKRNN